MRVLYPAIEPYSVHRFRRGHHEIYVEECGNPKGFPVVFLHGGPGSGCKTYHRCFFDPEKYRTILFDQRGAGRSRPQGDLADNTTAHLIEDMEGIRRHLEITRWLLFGGSWGATLALLYAQQKAQNVAGLVLRGTFLARHRDVEWFIGAEGAPRIYPEGWERFLASLPLMERTDVVQALYRRLIGKDELARRRAAREWALWGGQVTLGEGFDPGGLSEHVSAADVSQARVELHYAANRYFIDENVILDGCDRIPPVPVIIVHGRRDLVCPLESSWSLHRRLPDSEIRVLPQSGHIASGEEMIDALVRAADAMASRLAT